MNNLDYLELHTQSVDLLVNNEDDIFNEDNNITLNEDNNITKKKRGRKRKEDIIRSEMEEDDLLTSEDKIEDKQVNPEYYENRNPYTEIVLSAFLSRYRNIKNSSIRDNDDIISDSLRILNEVKKMSDIEYGENYELLLRHLNKEDIFE